MNHPTGVFRRELTLPLMSCGGFCWFWAFLILVLAALSSSVPFILAISNRWAGIGQPELPLCCARGHPSPVCHPCAASPALMSPNTGQELRLGSLSFLGYKRAHQNLQEETFSHMAAEESFRNSQVNVTTVICNALWRYFTLLTVVNINLGREGEKSPLRLDCYSAVLLRRNFRSSEAYLNH